MDGLLATAARQRSNSACCSPGLRLTMRAKSTATTAVMSATLKIGVAMKLRPESR